MEPEMGEVLATEFGMQLVRQHQLGRPLLELDSLTVIKYIREAGNIHTELGIICRNIQRLLETNKAAHIMEHSNTRWGEAEVWFDRPLILLIDQLSIDNVTASSD
ncbi:unnamed protein product [Linum tenue]|uniref:RNase H type-1 domain-containing protein n=1 Tax=Linum tenue TaxID=586396 RepID=A0AAV0IXI0_9ROSI|nr:unnamed protein product [Linum tenue]